MCIWFSKTDLFWHRKHDQRLHVYVIERIAKSAYYLTLTLVFFTFAMLYKVGLDPGGTLTIRSCYHTHRKLIFNWRLMHPLCLPIVQLNSWVHLQDFCMFVISLEGTILVQMWRYSYNCTKKTSFSCRPNKIVQQEGPHLEDSGLETWRQVVNRGCLWLSKSTCRWTNLRWIELVENTN